MVAVLFKDVNHLKLSSCVYCSCRDCVTSPSLLFSRHNLYCLCLLNMVLYSNQLSNLHYNIHPGMYICTSWVQMKQNLDLQLRTIFSTEWKQSFKERKSGRRGNRAVVQVLQVWSIKTFAQPQSKFLSPIHPHLLKAAQNFSILSTSRKGIVLSNQGLEVSVKSLQTKEQWYLVDLYWSRHWWYHVIVSSGTASLFGLI